MGIRYSDVFPILAKSIPGVEADDEDWKEPTPYFFLSDIVRFVCQRANSGSSVETTVFGALLERPLLEEITMLETWCPTVSILCERIVSLLKQSRAISVQR